MTDFEDYSWMKQPPSLEDQTSVDKLQQLLTRKSGEEFGHSSMKDVASTHRESLSPNTDMLSPDKAWFFPALLYTMVGLDKSIFEMWAWERGSDVHVTTHRADNLVCEFDEVDLTNNPWFYTVQGIDHADEDTFVSYAKSYRFVDHRVAPVKEWGLDMKKFRVADPLSSGLPRVGVYLWFMLPINMTSGKLVKEKVIPGLMLEPMVLHVEQFVRH